MDQHEKRPLHLPEEQQDEQPTGISRRGFLKRVSAFVAVSSIATVATSCQPETAATPAISPAQPLPTGLQYPQVPPSPTTPPVPGILRFFTPHEARTVDAFTARLLPGTPEDPGAREGGVVTYIDSLLAFREGYAEATYREPPYVQVYEGDQPPDDAQQSAFQVIWVPASEIERYGYQSILTPREVYRMGIHALDNYSRSQFNANFVDLSEEQQDAIITDMVEGNATGFEQFSAEAFFHVLRRHTAEGMFSDPVYGGNRNHVGWQLIGYPGAQRAYTEQDIRTEGTPREPQGLMGMSHFSPGQSTGHPTVILPVSGADPLYIGNEPKPIADPSTGFGPHTHSEE